MPKALPSSPELADKERTLPKWSKWVAYGLLVIAILVFLFMPLDRIRQYQVEVVPQADGSLNITYRLQWQVLNSIREGPLNWVKLGTPNKDYTLVETGGSIRGPRYISGPYIAFDLDKDYHAGQTADFWFTIHQPKMLCGGASEGDSPFYDLTPGWFSGMSVARYDFYWADSPYVLRQNATERKNGWLHWFGSLSEGQRVQMKLVYSPEAFTQPELISYSQYLNVQNYYGSHAASEDDGRVAVPIIVLAIILTCFRIVPGYRGGRSFHGGRGGGGGGGCACAGCACACACAGGGRAGCAAKDFYKSGRDAPRELKREHTGF